MGAEGISLILASFKEKVYEPKSVYLIKIFLLVLGDIWAMQLKKSVLCDQNTAPVNTSIMTLNKYKADMSWI